MIRFRGFFPVVVAAGLLMGGGVSAEAQVFTLPFQAPPAENSLGVYLSDFGDLAIEGVGRFRADDLTVGLRGGIADVGDVSLLVGADLKGPIRFNSPIDFAWTAGIQGLLGDADGIGIQGGVIIGETFVPEGGELRITPYIHPRLAFIDFGGGDDLELLADVGVDLQFARNLSLRFGVNLGDGADWGIGLAWR